MAAAALLNKLKNWWETGPESPSVIPPASSGEQQPVSPLVGQDWKMQRAQTIANLILPILGGVEAAASKGYSPGTGALAAQQNLNQSFKGMQDQQLQFRKLQEDAQDRALQKKVQESQLGELTSNQADKENQRAKFAEYQKRLGIIQAPAAMPEGQQGPVQPKKPEEQSKETLSALENYMSQSDPKAYADYLVKKQSLEQKADQPDFFTKLFATNQMQQNTPQKIQAGQTDALIGLNGSLNVLEKVGEKFNPKWAVPWVGQTIQNALASNDKDRAAFETLQFRFQNAILKAQSGLAVTESEATRLLREIGDLNRSPEAYITKLNEIHQELTDRYNESITGYQNSGIQTGQWKPRDYKELGKIQDQVAAPGASASFNSEQEARAAGFKSGDRVTIGGVPGTLN